MAGSTTSEDYRVRQYRPDDRAGVLALDDEVWDRDRGADWFDWKYGSNPYVDHTPLFVAERNGEVVGARPLMAFRMRAGDETAVALQPSDTMVHPDHRRQGIFTRMTERALEYYADREPEFFFNFPNEQSFPGYRKLGWREIQTKTTHYRIQNPDAFVPRYADGGATKVLGRLVSPLVRGYYDVQTRIAQPPEELTTERRAGLDVDALTTLYERHLPMQLHADRGRDFFEWRFASPVWERDTYVAAENGDLVAGLIARTRTTNDGVRIAQIADVVPMNGGKRWRGALAQLLGDALGDHDDADLVAVGGSVVPRDLLTAYGFYPDDRLPLSKFTDHRCALVARPIDGESWSFNGRDISRPANWLVSYGERDTT